MPTPAKDVLMDYLQGARDVLIWKLDGLTEQQVRMPHTPTGTNLLGLVKHALNSEALYFGPVFGRCWPSPEELVGTSDEPAAAFYAAANESAAQLIDLYRRVQAFANETIHDLPLDAIGHVPHWGNAEVTLLEVMIHKTSDLQRHAGHADIIREQIDGTTGLLPSQSNLPTGIDWRAHYDNLTDLAQRFQ